MSEHVPVREADIDPTFVQRYETNVCNEHIVQRIDVAAWPDDERAQRVWALSYLRVDHFGPKNEELRDVFSRADAVVAYINGGRR